MAAPTVVVSGSTVDEPAALASGLRKARWRILPLLGVCYLVAYMDRTNISFAAETMNRDLHFTARIYGLGAGLFFLSYALCKIPSNALLVRFGARRWLARIMLTWGLLAAAMVFVRVPWHFYGARLLLGCAEAGYFPGALFYLSLWFPTAVRARAIALFYVALPLSAVVMGSVAGALLRMDGRLGLTGWQWMFLMEAAPAVVLAFVVWLGLPKDLSEAKWLREDERAAMAAELARDQALSYSALAGESEGGLGRVLRNGRAVALAVAYFSLQVSWYAVLFSLPIVLGQLTGWEAGQVGYLVAGTGVVGAVAMLTVARRSDRSGARRVYAVTGYSLMAVCALAAGLHLSGWGGVAALLLFLLSSYQMQGPLLGMLTAVLPGNDSAYAVAFICACGSGGGVVGPYLMGWMRDATGGFAVGIAWMSVPCVVAAASIFWFVRDRRVAA